MSKVSVLSLEIRLNKFGTRVDVDLPQWRLTRIDEAVGCICRNNNNAAGFYFACFRVPQTIATRATQRRFVLSRTGNYTTIQRLVLGQDAICRELFKRAIATAFA